MNTTTPKHRKTTWNGAPLLAPEPFREWLTQTMRCRQLGTTDIAVAMGITERVIYRVLHEESAAVSELTVERAGIALDGDPRLAAQLYPELGA